MAILKSDMKTLWPVLFFLILSDFICIHDTKGGRHSITGCDSQWSHVVVTQRKLMLTAWSSSWNWIWLQWETYTFKVVFVEHHTPFLWPPVAPCAYRISSFIIKIIVQSQFYLGMRWYSHHTIWYPSIRKETIWLFTIWYR